MSEMSQSVLEQRARRRKEWCAEWYQKNKEGIKKHQREYYALNKTQVLLSHSIWKRNNHDKLLLDGRQYYEKNKDVVLAKMAERRKQHPEIQREWERGHKEERRAYHRRYKNEQYKSDVDFKIAACMRARLVGALRHHLDGSNPTSVSAVRDLGCTIPELRRHLETQFLPGMSWDNWGNKPGQWSIDHIRPFASFDLTNREQALQSAHYTNLQPLWHIDNLKKHDKWCSESEQSIRISDTIQAQSEGL